MKIKGSKLQYRNNSLVNCRSPFNKIKQSACTYKSIIRIYRT